MDDYEIDFESDMDIDMDISEEDLNVHTANTGLVPY